MVTKRSTSSALRPFHSVTIIICVFVTSGNASMGIFMKLKMPATMINPAQKKVKNLFFRENEMMFLMKLFTRMMFNRL